VHVKHGIAAAAAAVLCFGVGWYAGARTPSALAGMGTGTPRRGLPGGWPGQSPQMPMI